MASKEQVQEQNRADFWSKIQELRELLDGLGPAKAKRCMDLIMELKNQPRFMFLTIVREQIPNDISSLIDEEINPDEDEEIN